MIMTTKFTYQKFEAWAATLGLGIFVFVLLIESRNAENIIPYWFENTHTPFSFYKHFFIPYLIQAIAYYSAFIFLTQYVENKKPDWSLAGNIAGAYLVMATIVGITNTYAEAWMLDEHKKIEEAYQKIFVDSFMNTGIVFMIYLAYFLLKTALSGLIKKSSISKEKKSLLLKIVLGLSGWFFVLMLMIANHFAAFFIACWLIVLPYSLILFLISLNVFIPKAPVKKMKNRYYLSRLIPVMLLLSGIAAILFVAVMSEHTSIVIPAFVLIFLWGIIFIIPFSWYYYNISKEKQILQSALGSSEANLSFLRSQINPHFLFNALNTLYGTALQENAERTGEGIQRLGDMMRFMLHENSQEKILLSREIEYLTNYIALQRLRTATSPMVVIDAQIEPPLEPHQIAPMLLIPFVENAFKHGISLQQSSYIKLTLHTKSNLLYFDISNSQHMVHQANTEKQHSGIGLQNVKQRLQLLYPHRHELIIRESDKEYFVHLTLTL